MHLAFETRLLRTICEREIESRRRLGNPVADALQHRLADLRAAASVSDLVAGSPRMEAHGEIERLVIGLADDQEVVLEPNHRQNPVNETGMLDWSAVTRVKIVRIGGIDG